MTGNSYGDLLYKCKVFSVVNRRWEVGASRPSLCHHIVSLGKSLLHIVSLYPGVDWSLVTYYG